MSGTLLDAAGQELDRFLAPLRRVADDPELLDQLMATVGVSTPDPARVALLTSVTAIAAFKTRIDELLAQSSPSLGEVLAMLDVSREAFAALRDLEGLVGSSPEFAGLGEDLAGRLISLYLFKWHPLLRSITSLLAVQELTEDNEPTEFVVRDGEIVRGPFSVDRFHFDRLASLLRDPVAALRAEYGNALATSADADAMADKLFPRFERVLLELGVPCRYGFDPDDRSLLGDAAPFVEHALVVYAADPLAGAPAEAGIVFTISAADRGDLGLVISPFGTLSLIKQVGGWMIELMLTAGVDVLAYGRHGLTLLADEQTTEVAGSLSATLIRFENEPAFVLGSATGSRLEVGGAQLKLETSLSEARQYLALSANVSSSVLIIERGDGDGFLSSVLPNDGLQMKFDLGLEWSNERGLTFRGTGSLDATLPVGLSIRDVLTIPTIHLSLRASDAALLAEVSANVGLSLGPIHAAIERIGIMTAVTFPERGGNLGVADLNLGFKPPTGVGLLIDATMIVGGGFLRFDPEKQEYSGILQLEIAEKLALKAIGLLMTRMPGGAKGYSLLVIITAEDFPPIQLGYGFVLTGIGGLLAINRTFDEEALRAGLKNHTLDSVMFPQDPIRNAPQILSNLNRVFPPANGHHLFGPMAQISWGTPPLIIADLGVVLEIGARLRLLILAQVVAILPKRENDLVRLQMDAIGVIDFDQGTAALDAALYDSRLLKKFVLTGDMAMRMQWEGSPNFALAIGGLHPAFNPPANFPKLHRIAINLSSGDNPRIRCEAYFALTANTVQFGARAELYASAAGFSIQGGIGFDVLIQLDPFQFLAEFYAQVQLKRGSSNLFKVKVQGVLGGPRPLHLKAKATFEILWWDVSIRVDKTLVGGEKPPLPEPIDVLPLLKEALENSGNWVGELPDGQHALVTLRPRARTATEVLLHPLGTLTVKQGIVPLDLDVSRFGQAAPAGARRFTISGVTLGEQSQTIDPVKDFFAPAQFFEMSDDEKLSRPSFEPMTAGVSMGSKEFSFSEDDNDRLEVEGIEFETIIMNKEKKESRRSDPKNPYRLSAELFGKQARFGAAGVSEIRRSGRTKYRAAVGKYRVAKEGWSIVATESLTVEPVTGIREEKPVIYSEALQALQQLELHNPVKAAGLKIMRLSEMT